MGEVAKIAVETAGNASDADKVLISDPAVPIHYMQKLLSQMRLLGYRTSLHIGLYGPKKCPWALWEMEVRMARWLPLPWGAVANELDRSQDMILRQSCLFRSDWLPKDWGAHMTLMVQQMAQSLEREAVNWATAQEPKRPLVEIAVADGPLGYCSSSSGAK